MNILKKVSANIKNAKEIQKTIIVKAYTDGSITPTITLQELESAEMVDGVYVLHRPDIIAFSGGTVACAVSLTTGGNTYSIICTDYLYDALDEVTQKFVLYHELGHIVNKHSKRMKEEGLTNSYKYLMNRWFGNGIEMEYEADQYAADVLGFKNAIDGLINVYKLLGIIDKTANFAEFHKRINHINK